jgi:hypothetical protein
LLLQCRFVLTEADELKQPAWRFLDYQYFVHAGLSGLSGKLVQGEVERVQEQQAKKK